MPEVPESSELHRAGRIALRDVLRNIDLSTGESSGVGLDLQRVLNRWAALVRAG